VESEFEHDVGAMSFSGVDADAEEGGDFLVALAFREELQDFEFARSEAGARGFGRLGRVSGIGGGRDACREVRLVPAKGIDGCDEDAVGVLKDVAADAGFDHLLNERRPEGSRKSPPFAKARRMGHSQVHWLHGIREKNQKRPLRTHTEAAARLVGRND
jgi:hypothetical protein